MNIHVPRRQRFLVTSVLPSLVAACCGLSAVRITADEPRRSLLDAAREESKVTVGKFHNEATGAKLEPVTSQGGKLLDGLLWKGKRYRPVRCSREKTTLYHLWLGEDGAVVTDDSLNRELFTAQLFLPDPSIISLGDAVVEAENRAAFHQRQFDMYKSLAGDARWIALANEAFSAYVSPPDVAGAAQALQEGLHLHRSVQRLAQEPGELTTERIRELLKEKPKTLPESLLEFSNAAEDLKGAADELKEAGELADKQRALREALEAADDPMREQAQAALDDVSGQMRAQLRNLVWGLFTKMEDTKSVARSAVEFAVLNRAAQDCNRRLAAFLRRAAAGELESCDELELLSVWQPLALELRITLLRRYMNAVTHRSDSISGRLDWFARNVADIVAGAVGKDSAVTTPKELVKQAEKQIRYAKQDLDTVTDRHRAAARLLVRELHGNRAAIARLSLSRTDEPPLPVALKYPILAGHGVGNVVIGESTLRDVVAGFGLPSGQKTHRSVAYLDYKHLGLRFRYRWRERQPAMERVEIRQPFAGRTRRGIVVGKNTMQEVALVYGVPRWHSYDRDKHWYNRYPGIEFLVERDRSLPQYPLDENVHLKKPVIAIAIDSVDLSDLVPWGELPGWGRPMGLTGCGDGAKTVEDYDDAEYYTRQYTLTHGGEQYGMRLTVRRFASPEQARELLAAFAAEQRAERRQEVVQNAKRRPRYDSRFQEWEDTSQLGAHAFAYTWIRDADGDRMDVEAHAVEGCYAVCIYGKLRVKGGESDSWVRQRCTQIYRFFVGRVRFNDP